MREYCTTTKHIAEMNFNLLYVSITQKNWTVAQTFRMKISGLSFDRTEKVDPILNACWGLANLNLGNYRDAADCFLNVNPTYMTADPQGGVTFQRLVLSPNDIAIYGGLCALATMTGPELRTKVLENQPFRQFLELESHLRRAISMFCSAKFTSALSMIDSYAADYKLDLYLQEHFDKLYRMIRSKSLVQWFSAFSVVTLDEVVKAFPSMTAATVVEELEDLITSGTLDARIDLVNRVGPSSI
jgi:COP9 signalosome complex subunit 1